MKINKTAILDITTYQMSFDNWEPSNTGKWEHLPDVVWQLGTVQQCLSAVKRVWSFADYVLVTLNVNDNDKMLFQVI